MPNEEPEKVEAHEIIPTESPDTEMSKLISDDADPEIAIIRLEKIAALAPRWEQAMQTMLMSCTYPQDWEIFGSGDKAKACLSSAGVLRVAKHFPIKFFDVKWKKETWTDTHGEAYRYVYHGNATMGERIVYAQGNYSTRDKFLGSVGGDWKDIKEINEGFIRNAAYHIFEGNAIKALLGLRAMPVEQYKKLMKNTKQDVKKTTAHAYGKGTNGGTTQTDSIMQRELAECCLAIAQAGYVVELRDKDVFLTQMSDTDMERDETSVAVDICKEMSSFIGKDGSKVAGKNARELKGQRLLITHTKAKELAEKAKQQG